MKLANRKSAFTLVELLVVIAIIGILISMLLPAVQSMRESSRRAACMNNLRQIGIAFHSYENNYEYFPSGAKNGETWAVSILPFLELNNVAEIYDKTKPWNSAKNQRAVKTQITTFICPSNPNLGFDKIDNIGGNKTAASGDYAAITGVAREVYDEGFALPVTNSKGALSGRRCELRDVLDGLSNTIMLTEDVGRPVHYIANGGRGPDDLDLDSGNFDVRNGRVRGAAWADPGSSIPVHGFSRDGTESPGPYPINVTNNNEAYGFHPHAVVGLLCDGSVHVVEEGITMQQYSEFITRAGGETNNYDD